MKLALRTRLTPVLASALAAVLLATVAGCGGGSGGEAGKTFKILQYETPSTAQGQGWQKALEIFKAKHPDVKVEFQQTSFDAFRDWVRTR